jgi:hypothetical protein
MCGRPTEDLAPMQLTGTDLLFWAAGLFVHSLLLVVLFTRGRNRTFPIFTTLIAANFVKSLALYEIANHGHDHSYLIAYFSFATLDLVLQLSVTYEVARHVFCPTGAWAPDVRKGFLILVIGSIVVATILAVLPTPPEKTWLGKVLDRGNIFTAALQCELFVGMIAFSATARLPWKTHVARIAQGLGFFSFIGLLADAGHSQVPRESTLFQYLTFVRLTSYLISAGYWTVMLYLDAPEPRELPDEVRRQLFTLQARLEYDLRKLRALRR